MKKLLLAGAAITSIAMLSGCASRPYANGLLYGNQSAPLMVTNVAADCQKHGTSQSTSYLGLVTIGDASIAAAKEDGGITQVGTVDYHIDNLLGIIATTTTKVCGK